MLRKARTMAVSGPDDMTASAVPGSRANGRVQKAPTSNVNNNAANSRPVAQTIFTTEGRDTVVERNSTFDGRTSETRSRLSENEARAKKRGGA